jgi:hypothetical protein
MTEVTPTPEVSYDPYAKIVINKKPDYFSTGDFVEMTGYELSSIVRNETIYRTESVKRANAINDVEGYLVENYDDLESHADAIADLLGLSLTKTVEIEVNVTFTITAELKAGTDVDTIDEYNLEFTVDSTTDDFEISDYSSDVIYSRER